MMFEKLQRRMSMLAIAAAMVVYSTASIAQQTEDIEGPVAESGKPKIHFDEPTHDYGEVWSGTKADHTFIVKNTGDATLRITKVKPSCGCTLAAPHDKVIEPGQTGKIPITVNTARLRNKINKSITVSSNDPENPQYRLTVKGEVKQRFEITPVRAGSFGRINADEPIHRTLTLKNNTGQPVKLALKAPKQGPFAGELVETVEGQEYEFTIRANPPYQEKINRGTFKLATDLEDNSTVDIPVSAYVPPAVEIAPPELIITKANTTASQKNVSVKFNSADPHKILSAETDVPDATVKITENQTNVYNVALGLPADYMPPPTGHKLTIKTDDPKKEEIVVPLSPRKTPTRTQRPRPALTLANQPIPDATFTLADGSKISTKDMNDDATLVMFYASWCGFCKRAIPKLDEYAKEFEGKPAKILCVSMDSLKEEGATDRRARSKQQVTDQWKDLNVSLPQAFDSNKDGRNKFKVTSFPTMFLLGKNGKVERAYVGAGEVNSGQLKKEMEALLAGKLLPAQDVQTTAAAAPKPKRERPAMKLAGQDAPSARFTAAEDETSISLVDNDSDATVAFFYASWCGYCKKALPKLMDLSEAYALNGKQVRFVGVNQDIIVPAPDPNIRRGRTKDQVVKQWQDFGGKFQQVLDPNKLGRSQFQVTSYPTMFLINNKSNKVEQVYIGAGAVNDGSLKKHIDAVLEGKSISQGPKAGEAMGTALTRK